MATAITLALLICAGFFSISSPWVLVPAAIAILGGGASLCAIIRTCNGN